jgi:ribosome-binding protein aMBF1 (putative translation factor)
MHKSIYTRQYQTLLEILREARATAGLTQGDLAERLGMGQSDISKCEIGTRRLDVVELKLWVEALGIELMEVVQELDEQVKSEALLARQHPAVTKSKRGHKR